jgi:inosine triphosphate pyrophosphatase
MKNSRLPTIVFVTGNPNKLQELEAIAPPELQFDAEKIDLDEIQDLDVRRIVEHKLRQAYATVKRPVIVEDVSAELVSLNGLPGPFIKFFEKQLGRGALYTLSKVTDDAVTIRCVAGYFDGIRMLFGEGIVEGTITAPRGENGFGFDCVVVPNNQPDGRNRTVAEMSTEEKNAVSHRAQALTNLLAQIASTD